MFGLNIFWQHGKLRTKISLTWNLFWSARMLKLFPLMVYTAISMTVYSAIFEQGISLVRLLQESVDVADDGEMRFIKKCAIANNVQIIAWTLVLHAYSQCHLQCLFFNSSILFFLLLTTGLSINNNNIHFAMLDYWKEP